MALVGKYTKYEIVDTGETEMQTVEYPSDLPEGHPDFDKAGTSEEVEVPVFDSISTDYEDVYVTVHCLMSWKFKSKQEDKTLFNITYRVYENKEDRTNDIDSHIVQEFVSNQEIDYSSEKNEIQQAYELVKTSLGCDELIND